MGQPESKVVEWKAKTILCPEQRNITTSDWNVVDDMELLRRFLYLGTDSTYIPSHAYPEPKNAELINRLIKDGKGKDVVQLIARISHNGWAPRQKYLIFALAVCARSNDVETKKEAYALLNTICRTPTHLFMFVNYCQLQSGKSEPPSTGWGRAHKRAVLKWYEEKCKNPGGIARLLTKYKSRKMVENEANKGNEAKKGNKEANNGNEEANKGNEDTDNGNEEANRGNEDTDNGNEEANRGNQVNKENKEGNEAKKGNKEANNRNEEANKGNEDTDNENEEANRGNRVNKENKEANEGNEAKKGNKEANNGNEEANKENEDTDNGNEEANRGNPVNKENKEANEGNEAKKGNKEANNGNEEANKENEDTDNGNEEANRVNQVNKENKEANEENEANTGNKAKTRNKAKKAKGNKWSHKDIFRLGHPSSADILMKVVREFVLNGFKKAQNLAPKETENNERVMEFLTYIEGTIKAKKCTDEDEMIKLIKTHGLEKEHVPNQMMDSRSVWEAIVKNMKPEAKIRSICMLSAKGLLGEGSDIEKEIKETLTNDFPLYRAKVHPIKVLSALLTYEKGETEHRPKAKNTEPKKWNVNKNIVNALYDAFEFSFKDVHSTKKQILLAVDVGKTMKVPCAGCPAIRCHEAAAAMMMMTVRNEPNCKIFGFSDSLTNIDVHKMDSLSETLKKIDLIDTGKADSALPMLWAEEKKEKIDVFIVYTDNISADGKMHPSKALAEYRKTMNRPEAKLAVVALASNRYTIADTGEAQKPDNRAINIVGFDANAAMLIAKFICDEI